MGFFSELFGKSTNDEPEEKKEEKVQLTNKNLFKGKNQVEVKNHLMSLLNAINSNNSHLDIEKNIEIISNFNYHDSEKEILTGFLKSNYWLSNIDYHKMIQLDITFKEKRLKESTADSTESKNCLAIIEFLNNLKSKEILFCLSSTTSNIIIYVKDGQVKIFDSLNLWGQIIEYNVFDINFIFNFFKQQYSVNRLYEQSDKKAILRYELLNSNLKQYIEEYYQIIELSGPDRDSWEYGFLFENKHVSTDEFIGSIKRFVFISNLFDAIMPIVRQNNERALSEFKFDSLNNLILTENGFDKLIRKNQSKIAEIDKNYIHKFVKLSSYLNKKKENIITFYKTIDKENIQEIQLRTSFLKELNQNYDLLLFHSINMVGSLMKGDLVSFYEIYEVFDKLGVFNSNWENEVAGKLTQIGDSLMDLIDSIHEMENNIIGELINLTYVTQASFEDLNKSVTNQLKEVESSINTNNLLQTITTYQVYKINKNTK